MEYPTVAGVVGVVISSRFATLHELQTIYSYADMMDMYEVHITNKYNEARALEVNR
jgi:hypothetical protein